MSDVIMLIFPSRGHLIEATEKLQSLPGVKLKNTAMIVKADDGETVVLEDDIAPAEGSVAGGTLGGLMTAVGVAQLGAFLLPGVGPILAIGAGALIGALVGGATGGATAGLLDFGFKNSQLEALGNQLQAGRTALVVEVEGGPNVVQQVTQELAPYNAELVTPVS
jgi:uncharacterized membrane protein